MEGVSERSVGSWFGAASCPRVIRHRRGFLRRALAPVRLRHDRGGEILRRRRPLADAHGRAEVVELLLREAQEEDPREGDAVLESRLRSPRVREESDPMSPLERHGHACHARHRVATPAVAGHPAAHHLVRVTRVIHPRAVHDGRGCFPRRHEIPPRFRAPRGQIPTGRAESSRNHEELLSSTKVLHARVVRSIAVCVRLVRIYASRRSHRPAHPTSHSNSMSSSLISSSSSWNPPAARRSRRSSSSVAAARMASYAPLFRRE